MRIGCPAVDDQAGEPVPAAIQEGAVGAPEIFRDELPRLVAKDAQMPRGDIGIIDDDVVIVAAADPHFRAGDPKSGAAISRWRERISTQIIWTHAPLSRKRLPSAMGVIIADRLQAQPRDQGPRWPWSCVTAIRTTSYRPSNSR